MQKKLLLPLFVHCLLKKLKIIEVYWCVCCHLMHEVS